MWIDARQMDDGTELNTDVLVIGGGAGGLALSMALEDAGIDVLLAEAGDDTTRNGPFCEGFSQAGAHPFDISGRRRAIGGGLTEWGGNCALAQAEDFQPRRVRDFEGASEDLLDWPFDAAALSARTDDVEALLHLPPGAFDVAARIREPIRLLGTRSDPFRTRRYLRADTGRGLAAMRQRLAHSGTRVLTNARCVGLLGDGCAGKVVGALLASGRDCRLRVAARRVVLCAGLDNAMLMMQGFPGGPDISLRRWPALGRYLHSHFLALHGFVLPGRELRSMTEAHALPLDAGGRELWQLLWRRADPLRRRETSTARPTRTKPAQFDGLDPGADLRRAEGLLNGVTWLAPVWRRHPLMSGSVRRAAPARPWRWQNPALTPMLGDLAMPRAMVLRHFVEQVPRADARIRPGLRRDALDWPEAVVHWRMCGPELRTIQRLAELAITALGAAGCALPVPVGAPDPDDPEIHRNTHPMGGTIAGTDPRHSVVDGDLRVHSVENLYICGGSVIPRGGSAMVTGIILQLAMRLAQHLTERA